MVRRCRSFREMRSQRVANFVDRFDQSVAEFFVPKMFAHFSNQSLPQFLATLLVDRLVPDDCELMRAGRNEDENVVMPSVFIKAQFVKPSLGRNQRIVFQFTTLNKNADLAGRF